MLRALLGLLFLLPACSSAVYVEANLQCYGVGAAALDGKRAFRIVPAADAVHPLRDAALARIVADDLTLRGLTERAAEGAAAPDELLCSLRTEVREDSQYVPPQTRIVTTYRPGRTWRYRVVEDDGGAQWVTVHEPGEWLPETWTTAGRIARTYVHVARLELRDAAGRELWRADVSAATSTGDAAAVLGACLSMAMAEFPTPSGLPADRRFELQRIQP